LGDFNVAAEEIDIYNPAGKSKKAGFTDLERAGFRELLGLGFFDVFRELYPKKRAFTFWDYRLARKSQIDAGWRIDYFLCDSDFFEFVKDTKIYPRNKCSDHAFLSLSLFLRSGD